MKIVSRQEAIEQGLKKYFTGKPCKHGHISERHLDASCVTCKQEEHIRNKARKAAYDKQYREKTKESRAEYQANYREKHKEELSEKRKEYRNQNKEKLAARDKNYHQLNRDKALQQRKEHYQQNKEDYLERVAKRRAIKLQATPGWYDSRAVKKLIVQSRKLSELKNIQHNVDHIVPLNSDFVCGLHWHGNMQILTQAENFSKSNRRWPDMPDINDPELLFLVKQFKLD
jgi:hypothetical protein